ncbi:MAG: DpnD/PcfM family protein [Muribaculaceae bacterium]|nr:DpnD/PcfM family protein [Muribaculaceae bacterium]
MKKYKVQVTQVLVKTIEIEANTQAEAVSIAKEMDFNGEIEFICPDHNAGAPTFKVVND